MSAWLDVPVPPVGDPTVIFLHIGKTAGATLRKVLQRNVPPSKVLRIRNPLSAPHGFLSEDPFRTFAALPEAEQLRPRLILAHMMFGLHDYVPRGCTYITLFRHPVARVLSGYKNAVRHPEHRFHDLVVSQRLSLAEYVTSGVALEMDNSLLRAILSDVDTPFGQCTPSMLERAKSTLRTHFTLVGLSEKFDETLVLLDELFGWHTTFYVKANVSPVALARSSQSQEVVDVVEEQNRLDIELYNFAADRMTTQMETLADFRAKLERLRRGNELYRRWGALTYTRPRQMMNRLRP